MNKSRCNDCKHKPPVRTNIRQQVYLAIKKGFLKKTPCIICGSVYRIEGHHQDYSKPLTVLWLCQSHHRKIHPRKMKPKDIVSVVCRDFGIKQEYLLGRNRSNYTIKCRTEIVRQLRNTGLSYPEIGKLINRDHSSIMHLYKRSK